MSTFEQQTQFLSKIYPEHTWIEIEKIPEATSFEKLNRIAIEQISNYLVDMGLVVKTAFPTEDSYLSLVSKVVDGFVILVSGVKVAFIPSQNIDLAGFEIHQEWIDLDNWAADYYVPFQIVGVGEASACAEASRNENCEYNYLHLWGFISHQSIQQKADLDRTLRSYEIDSADLITLDTLWVSCELVGKGIASERGKVPHLAPLSTSAAAATIDRLQQHQSVFSPRLLLSFEEWGAIMNTPEYLHRYAHPVPAITKIANWFHSQVTTIDRVAQGWLTIEQIYQQPQLLPGYYHTRGQKDRFLVSGVALSNEQEINRAVNNLYTNQNPTCQVDLPANIDSPLVLLTYLIQHTTEQTLRWQAAEYLWQIAPENSQNWQRRIKDLGLVIQGHKLGLMVAAIPLLDGTYAILNRVYPIGSEAYLPPNVQLSLLSEHGERLYHVESRSTVMDSYIQFYFTASVGDLFSICINLNGASINEAFSI
jgi:Protein of unknown function (DUF1822)